MSAQKGETLLFVGHARLPGNIVPGSGTDVISLELEVDSSTDRIINACCSCLHTL